MLANCQGVVLKPTPLPVSASTTHVFLGDMTKEASFLDHFHAMNQQQEADVTVDGSEIWRSPPGIYKTL